VLLNDVSMTSLSNTQSTVDMAIEQWRGRLGACVRAKGGHFEHSLWTYWLCWFCQPFITSV